MFVNPIMEIILSKIIKLGLTISKNGDIMCAGRPKQRIVENCMNNTINMNRTAARRRAPAWLVTICRIILWITSEPVADMLRAVVALSAVALMALVAGAMDFGAMPMTYGIVICAALVGIALHATNE